MKLDATTWSRVGELFDELASLAPRERERHLAQKEIAEPVRRWLDKLLTAHDTPDPSLLDRAVDDIVGDLLDDPAARVPTTIEGRCFGPWRAIENIGRGGMGVVVRGERADGQFQKDVAIKLLPPGPATSARAERLGAEIRLLASLEHANIAHLLDGGLTEDGIPYLVMEYVDGVSIDDYCAAHRLNLRQRVALMVETTRAVAYSHRRLVVHCDIKPGNVMVTADGQVKVVDFGVAARLKDAPEAEAAFPALHCSPGYAAPEQLAGRPPAVAHDIFALGALLYELITGRRLRGASSTTRALVGRVPDDEIAAPSATAAVDADLDAICLKALATDPERRYAGTEAMLRDLEAWLRHRPVEARQGGRVYRAGKWLRRHHWAAAAGGMAIVSLVTGTGLALWQAGEARTAAAQAEAEAIRATAALAETEQALSRAESLREFLIGLFRAAQIDRPPDQLPSTQDILESGARAAMDEDGVDPAERFGMLHTIAQIHLEQNRFGEAGPLITEAVALARRHQETRPQDLARALLQQSVPMIRERELDQARGVLIEAEAAVEGAGTHWEILARVRTERAWVERLMGRPEVTVELLEPLYVEMQSRSGLEPKTRIVLKDHLASVYNAVGRLEEAAYIRTRLLELSASVGGSESTDYAISLSNSVALEYNLGRHDIALERAREAVEIYDRITDRPIVHRAAVRGNLAMVKLELGEFDAALAQLKASAQEWAVAEGRELENFELRYHYRGVAMARLQRWEEAGDELARARELFALRPNPHQGLVVSNDALLANALCRLGDAENGNSLLRELEQQLGGEAPSNRNRQAEWHEARAACHLSSGRPHEALSEIELALAVGDNPGRVIQRATRHLFKATVLHILGDHRRVEQALAQAEAVYLDFDLGHHPHHALVEAARRDLLPDG